MTGRLPEGQSEENMRQDEIIIRAMEIEDYDQVRSLWMTIRGFGIRSIDDSREEIARFLKRNPTTSVVAEKDGRVIGAILCGRGISTMYVSPRRCGGAASAGIWSFTA